MDWTETLLKELTEAPGVPGNERAVAAVMEKYLKPLGVISYDRLGSIIAKKRGTKDKPKVLVAGHMDEVGFVVSEITKNGYIKFLPLGGWWGPVAFAQRMKIYTKNGPVIGVTGAKPPHLLTEEERKKQVEIKDLFIDVGATGEFDVKEKLGIRPGDPVVPDSTFTILANPRVYLSKAFDNRFGCAAVIELFTRLKDLPHPNTVFGAGTVQEEVGLRGATTVAHLVEPDVALIADVSIARDTPGIDSDSGEKMGAGVSILVHDSGLIPNWKLVELVIQVADANGIPYHMAALERGTTDGARVQLDRSGVPTVALGIPTRYIHAHSAMLNRDDYDNYMKLLVALVQRLDETTVAGLIK